MPVSFKSLELSYMPNAGRGRGPSVWGEASYGFLGSVPLWPLPRSWPKPMVNAVIPARPPNCIDSTAVLGTITMVAFFFNPS